jgi:hypothetical protein
MLLKARAGAPFKHPQMWKSPLGSEVLVLHCLMVPRALAAPSRIEFSTPGRPQYRTV